LIRLSEDLDILVSRQVNDWAGIEAMINKTGRALAPVRATDRPHPHFLAWHRDHVFKS
jgi:putative restriction endonuclease